MTEISRGRNAWTMWLVVVVVALLALVTTDNVFVIVFAAAVVYLLWTYHARIKKLEERLSTSEKPSGSGDQTV
ncbi:MAG TPA: hypothetical protein VLY21_05335 [Nitrososphaerales archaeon]|nr:hypothetical protein [Nitrososphaerales archaeon]